MEHLLNVKIEVYIGMAALVMGLVFIFGFALGMRASFNALEVKVVDDETAEHYKKLQQGDYYDRIG